MISITSCSDGLRAGEACCKRRTSPAAHARTTLLFKRYNAYSPHLILHSSVRLRHVHFTRIAAIFLKKPDARSSRNTRNKTVRGIGGPSGTARHFGSGK